jgi:hypothetical protein
MLDVGDQTEARIVAEARRVLVRSY